MTENIPDDRMQAYVQAWKLLDGDETGKLPVSVLGRIFRAFGKNPSEKEVETIIVGHDLDRVKGSVTFEEVLPLFIEVKDSSIDVKTLRKSFKMFDEEESGTISVDNLREALCKLGEPLTTDEVDYLAQLVEVKDHKIRYDEIHEIKCLVS
ncbi:hypothetical protein ACJMK2_036831 [Sinanodonta woodiana]|uniref:EF-hand domain-containing protein n=1 Tax=Sinanodonta woodiana TaxID=1069815 RepID=A0ABD3WLW4_SINWO